MLPFASYKYSRLQLRLITQASNGIDKYSNCNCSVFPELDWKTNDDTVVRPEIKFVCGEPKNDFLEMPPVLVIEILSPSILKTDSLIKFELYQENGIQFYLMVYPIKENVEVFELIDNTYKQVDKKISK